MFVAVPFIVLGCIYCTARPHTLLGGEHRFLAAFDVGLICILKASDRRRGRRKGEVITLTDSVYVAVGTVGTDRLDKVSDWPAEIYGQRVTVNIHLVFLWTGHTFARPRLRDCDLSDPWGPNLIRASEAFTFTQNLEREEKSKHD